MTQHPHWSGSPLRLLTNDSATMTPTPDGTMVLAWRNVAAGNDNGTLTWTSGGSAPAMLDAPAQALAPTIMVDDWQGNDLRITNTSTTAPTPIIVQAYGPGLGRSGRLPFGKTLPLEQGQSRLGPASGGRMSMALSTRSGALALFAIVGGPCDASGNNATVVALNFPQATAPAGYTAVTTGPSYSFDLDWLTTIYVAFFGPGQVASPSAVTASGASVRLVEL